jgi:hypothetical protein
MGAVPAESGLAVSVDREADPRSPPEPVRIAFDRLDHDLALDTRDLAEQLSDARCLQPALRAQLHMLEIAAPAAAGPGVATGRLDPVGRGVEHLHGVRPEVRVRRGGDPGPHPLAGERVTDEHHLAVGCPADAAATAGNGADLELEELVATSARHPIKRTAANEVKISL